MDRARFDHLLLRHAEDLGSRVLQGVPVREVLFDGSRARGVRVDVNGKDLDLEARVVVDATGRRGLIGRHQGLFQADPIFNQYAVHAWFEDVDRGPEKTAEFIHIYFLPIERGWAWQIPITDKITSLGVVAEKDVFRQSRGDLESYFRTHIESHENLAQALRPARRINDFKQEGDYSYSMKKFCGDGFLLIGDAARFVDPIFSSGVSVALYSAKFAAEAIQEGLARNDVSAAAFQGYDDRLRSGVNIWYEFIRLYYKLLPLFTYFIQSKKHRLQVLRLLQGEVFERKEVPVLQAMRDFIKTVEESDNHAFKEQLSGIPLDDLQTRRETA